MQSIVDFDDDVKCRFALKMQILLAGDIQNRKSRSGHGQPSAVGSGELRANGSVLGTQNSLPGKGKILQHVGHLDTREGALLDMRHKSIVKLGMSDYAAPQYLSSLITEAQLQPTPEAPRRTSPREYRRGALEFLSKFGE